MLQVTHTITIGSDKYSSPAHSRLISLDQSSRMDTLVNVCSLIMAPPAGLTIEPDDDIEVELGNGNSSGVVFTGKVLETDWRIKEVRVSASSSARLLSLARYNMYFEKYSAGQIVTDICNEASVSAGQVDDGITFDYYAIADNRDAADHIRNLARLCGFEAHTDEKDQVVFAASSPGTPHPLKYAVNILEASIRIHAEGYVETDFYGESPSSFGQGSSASTWFTKTEVSGTASKGSGLTLPFFNPSIRTVDQASTVAQSYLDYWKAKKKGFVSILGDPDIKPGDAVQIDDMPVNSQNGLYKVTGVEHRINRIKGFITRLTLKEI